MSLRQRPFPCAALLALALGAVLGCAAGRGSKAAAPQTRGVPIEELPARQRGALEAWREGEESWLERRAAIVADPELADFLVDNLIVVLVRSYDAGQFPGEGPPRTAHERARAELVRQGERAAPVLAEMLVVGDGVVAYLAGEVLARIEGPLGAPPVSERLAGAGMEGRRRAAELLERLPSAGAAEGEVLARLGAVLAGDPEWIVRAQAARALGVRAARGAPPASREPCRLVLVAALGDADEAVRTDAARALGLLGDPRAVPSLVQRLDRALRSGDPDPKELRALQGALRSLTGEPRDRDAAGWRLWMDRNAERLRG